MGGKRVPHGLHTLHFLGLIFMSDVVIISGSIWCAIIRCWMNVLGRLAMNGYLTQVIHRRYVGVTNNGILIDSINAHSRFASWCTYLMLRG